MVKFVKDRRAKQPQSRTDSSTLSIQVPQLVRVYSIALQHLLAAAVPLDASDDELQAHIDRALDESPPLVPAVNTDEQRSDTRQLLLDYLQGKRTENLAPSHSTTGSHVLNAFFKLVRHISDRDAIHLFELAFQEDALMALRLLFHRRDIRGGVGERKIFRTLAAYMAVAHPRHIEVNMELIGEYGRYDDALLPFIGSQLESTAICLMANQLRKDIAAEDSISLAAKWVPSEGTALDRRHQITKKLAVELGVTKGELRQQYLTPLRKRIGLIETVMSEKRYDAIQFDKVPSKAMLLLRKAFSKHCKDAFLAYLESVKKGEAKVNVRALQAHELVRTYVGENYQVAEKEDALVEQQWLAKCAEVAKLGNFRRAVVMSDTSGSMLGDNAILVSISLGLMVSAQSAPPYRNQLMTFESTPHLVPIPTDCSLLEKCRFLLNSGKFPWGGSTNVQGAFDLLLSTAKAHRYAADDERYPGRRGLAEEDMPETLFIISDMQFDAAIGNYSGSSATNFDVIKRKYADAGYALPKVVFWNVRAGTRDFPVQAHESGAVLLSGFSTDILQSVLEGKELSPLAVMIKALSADRYRAVRLPN